MPVDPRIFENLKLPTAREPLKMFEDIARLKVLESESQIRQADAQLRQRKAQQDEEHTRIVQTAWQQSGGDPVKAIKMVGEAGYGGLALEMQKELTGIQNVQQDIEYRPKEFQQRQQQIEQTGAAQVAASEDRDLARLQTQINQASLAADRAEDNARADEAAAERKREADLTAQYRQMSLDMAAKRLQATLRGQDIGATTARRGQDMAHASGINPESTMPPEYQTALSRTLFDVPATRRPLVVQTAERLWKAGDLNGLKDVIRQSAIEGENVAVKDQVMGRMATLASLNDTTVILKEMQQKGVPTGFFTGTVEDLVRKVGTTQNPEYVALANRLAGTLINYRRAATGVQFGEREQAEYAKMFPNYRNTLPVNLALIEGLKREMGTYDRTYWEHKLGKDGAALVGMVPASESKTSDDGSINVGEFKVRVVK